MRSEKEMFDLILGFAKKDERIRAVYMNGSRTNPNVQKDIFQDYDIVYVVTGTASFLADEEWINVFGDLLMIQEPDKLDQGVGIPKNFDRSYTYLMLFTDGNRIDLHLETKESMLAGYETDKLTLPLLDKDDILPIIPPPTDIDYHVKKPSEGDFNSCTNNFWWCLQNVAKGIWRDELPYVKWMYEYTTRDSLDKMVSWWIGVETDFQVSAGKLGKYFKVYLPEDYWNMYKATYSSAYYEQMWDSIFITCELFRMLSQEVAKHFGFTYPTQDDQNMMKYLRQVRELSKGAREIF
ncbi:aminoglycoside 6-adenylyltransferase [Anaerobacillus alkaliphilus]|uniref:Aminoglycoside 6-adenylyltransferase n=1 Tax=Anaerobacillus alkaliphilus TaxID=1548597 RepID=A0A4Q0VXX2_9BACI|nr:aminoglycoside 6-adenylyltransferase [Anaerobacillus alkaliphilus]RXJ04409.1 aminoglycoside 6-adenylyltransferase [Anaerobacillus alkaliphilus]